MLTSRKAFLVLFEPKYNCILNSLLLWYFGKKFVCIQNGIDKCAVLERDKINDSWEALTKLRYVTLEELCTLFCQDANGDVDICDICGNVPDELKLWTLGGSSNYQKQSICCNNKYWGCLTDKCVEDCPKTCRDNANNNWGNRVVPYAQYSWYQKRKTLKIG